MDFIQRANADYVEAMYQKFREDPESVPDDWAMFFSGFEFAGLNPDIASQAPSTPSGVLHTVPSARYGGAFRMVQAYREFGHLIAQLDPLGEDPQSHPLLDIGTYGLTEEALDQEVETEPFRGEVGGQRTLRDLIDALRDTYCRTFGVEYIDIPDKDRRDWLQERMEAQRNRPLLSGDDRIRILKKLLQADKLEQFLHVKFVGQKRFSLEGGSSLIPMLDHLIETAASIGVEQLVIGMPHRGRLNVLANIMKKPYERMFSEFETSYQPKEVQGHGDVKYHLGYSSLHTARSGRNVHLDLNFNPSHLEFVNPVVLGSVRARQAYMDDPNRERGVPVLIHGDAAFVGEGIVPETLTLAQLPAYRAGGAIHIVLNNQVGFTTSPEDSRPARYPTDISRVIEAPVFHVNGDDPEAAIHAIALAVAYRARFKREVIVQLVCYRKHGHNELDDPTFTQPVMYQKIKTHVSASRQYADKLLSEGVIDQATLDEMEADISRSLNDAYQRVRDKAPSRQREMLGGAWAGFEWAGKEWGAETGVEEDKLKRIIRSAAQLPEGFTPHPKVEKLLRERIEMVDNDAIDWGTGEVLAFGSLLLESYHLRLSGQDSARGTFSHRHAIVHDRNDGRRHVPLQHLARPQGRCEIIDSMLSEAAVLGYEYGYSTADPRTLVIWEAQFGDFTNVAQVYIDQFIASGESKWNRMSGITLLLPHGYEGQGPEHSSARLERFLELCANGNIQVCNLTTPAQLFHGLRRQMHRQFRKPLVIMSPKSLLRHKLAVSSLDQFTSGSFRTVLDDPHLSDPNRVRAVLAVSGKLYYMLHEKRAKEDREDLAIVRVEQLYPFPASELETVMKRYPNARELRWVQEEPANMGAWRHLRHRFEAILPESAILRMVARRAAPTPATGYYHMHVEEEKALLEQAFAPAVAETTSQMSVRSKSEKRS